MGIKPVARAEEMDRLAVQQEARALDLQVAIAEAPVEGVQQPAVLKYRRHELGQRGVVRRPLDQFAGIGVGGDLGEGPARNRDGLFRERNRQALAILDDLEFQRDLPRPVAGVLDAGHDVQLARLGIRNHQALPDPYLRQRRAS